MKFTKKILSLFVLMVAFLSLAGCDFGKDQIVVQGVTDTKIVVGNTAATSGYFAGVGVPFNDAIEAVFKQVNDNGGIGGREIEFIHYDDGFDPDQGLALTEKLVEEDEVFALVGHFGTPTVGSTLDYIREINIPMVYAATGINALYFEQSSRNPVMAVQPIYLTEGKILVARVFNEALFGENGDEVLASDAKVGVIYTNEDAGKSIKAGIEIEAEELGKEANLIYEVTDENTYGSSVTKMMNEGVEAVILATNQAPFLGVTSAMYDANFNVPVFSSYVNANVSYVDENKFSEGRPLYLNAWVDIFSAEGQDELLNEFVPTIMQANLPDEVKYDYLDDSFAIAGYIAANVFIEGLRRVEEAGKELTWRNYIAEMEDGPIDIPMGGEIDFTNGKRWGIDSLALLRYVIVQGDNPTTPTVETSYESFVMDRGVETLNQIIAKGISD